MTVSAVTDNATLRVLFWGGDAGVPAAGAGETRTAGIPDVDAAVINANTPRYTKVVGTSFVAMIQGERDAVDAVLDPIENAATAAQFYALLAELPTHDYGNVGGPVVIDMNLDLRQKLTLTADLVLDDITITLPTEGSKTVTVEIIQDGTGNWEIATDAWPANANFGSNGFPAFGEVAGSRRFLMFDYDVGDAAVNIHNDTNIF